ncbi:hypothetical protein ACFR9U_16215 [Halorientalis brevis]|uniref:DUF8156 domain-containing protein n=1 Tax=Halorientalis brevis TaxID=1126241 RepID=A0ABD6CF83_9EURY|nr:hypothetical protein [Halorientalis brevis]
MGKTNPTFRDQVNQFVDEYQQFRRGLVYEDQQVFDDLLEHAHAHADAAGYLNPHNPREAILMSLCLGHQREIEELRAHVEDLRDE